MTHAGTLTCEISIDGVLDESDWQVDTRIDRVIHGTLSDEIYFDVLWSSTHLYIGVISNDESIVVDSDERWNDDAMELAFDGGHEGGDKLDENDDHCQFGLDSPIIFCESADYTGADAGFLFESRILDNGEGWLMEIGIPWSHLKVNPEKGSSSGDTVLLAVVRGPGGGAPARGGSW